MFASGHVIAYPTETSYGLGCDPRDVKAVSRIFKMKGRSDGKPVLLVAASIAQVTKVVDLSRFSPASRKTFNHLAKEYWPGALTIILPVKKSAKLARLVAPKGEIAIRVSSSPFASTLAKRHGFPIVSTSANRAGQEPCRSLSAIMKAFPADGLTPDIILDGGSLPRRKPSTLVRILQDGDIEVLRLGAIRPTL